MIFRAEAHAWLRRATGAAATDLTIVQMAGSTSSSLFRIEHAEQRFVLRVLDNQKWLADEPDLAGHEAGALTEARRGGLPAPELVAYADGDVGFGAPAVLMSFVPGTIELRPADFSGWLVSLAGQLAAIHRHEAEGFPWRYRSWVKREAFASPAWSAIAHTWERAIEVWQQGAPDARPVFIHRDYHPVNVLWRGAAISGVVDWINACQGPAGVDVAHCRTNLASMYGVSAADEFLALYTAAADGFTYHPYWDLDSLLDMCLAGPSYYPPWQEFGLEFIPPPVMRQRAEDYLASVMRRIG